MKKSLFIVLALLIAGMGFAQKAPTTKLISNTEQQIVVNFQLNGYTTDRVQTPQGDQYIVNVPGMAAMLEAGAPDLPMFPIPAIIGDQAEMTVSVIDAQYTDYANVEVAPSKGNFSRQINPNDVPYTYGEMYQQDAFWPATQAYLEKPYILRDFRGQNIMVRPFAYNPLTKTLRVYTNLTLAMTKVSDNGENPKATRRSNTIKVDPEQKAQYSRRFINFGESSAKYIFDEDFGEMLIICADMYMSNLQPFVEWKNQSGRPTTMVSVTTAGGNNIENIKNYVSNYYNDPSHNLEFLLLVGEYSDITPKNYGYGDGGTVYSDNYLGKLEGNDNYLEVLVGRFSVNSAADADLQVSKSIYYERDVQAGAAWGNKGMGIGYYGAGSGHYGEDDYQHIDYIRDTLLHYTYQTVTEHHGGSGGDASTTTISATINQGISIINYCNHGNWDSWGVAGYSVSNVAALTNDGMLPVVWSVACLNGQFDHPTCFAESWLRAKNNATGAPTGAVAGMFSFVSQPWVPPMYGQDEMVDILTGWRSVEQFNHTIGGASLNGSMYVLDKAPNDSYQTFNSWLLFGDPSALIRTDIPTTMNVNLNPAVLMIGMSSLEVSADTDCGIATLSNEDGVIASAKIVNGTANLEFPALNAVETLTLTVVGYNKETLVMPIEVLPAEGAYLTVNAFTPGNVPVAEEQLMSMTFKNVGADPTTGTTNVVLSSTDSNISFSDNEGSFGVVAADETITLTDEFAFTIAPGVPDGTQIQIDVNMTCDGNIWAGKAKIVVGAPMVAFDGFEFLGGFIPGEIQNVSVTFRNDGHYMATNAVVTATTTNEYAQLIVPTFELGNIDAEGTVTAVFSVMIDPTCPNNEVIELSFDLTADNEVTATGTGLIRNHCNVVFNLQDSYGDGWNGNALVVSFDDGTPSQQLTIGSGNSASYTLTIGMGVNVTLSWIVGNYTNECSFTVLYEGGEQITTGSNLGQSYSFSFVVNCEGSTPVIGTLEPVNGIDFFVNNADQTLRLTWREPEGAIGYLITKNSELVGMVTENEFIDDEPNADQANYCVTAQYYGGDAEQYCEDYAFPWGVEEQGNSFQIYPNPVNNTLYIQGNDTEYSYVMVNGMGQQVANGTANGTKTINVKGMGKGVYFLRITTGSNVITQKVVVE